MSDRPSLEICQQAHQRALAISARIQLPLRSRVWKGQSGEFAGAGTGSSLDFQDHRLYAPGDDPRHINWQAYARTGSYSMKLYREEVRPVVDLILDVSASMFFEESKATRSTELFYLCAESARRQGASLHLHLIHGDQSQEIPYEALAQHHWMDRIPVAREDALFPSAWERMPLQGQAIRIFISDLLFPGSPEPLLRGLGARQSQGIVLSPYLQEEAEPTWQGHYEMIDAENESRHPHRIDPSTLTHYRNAYLQHFSLWKEQAVRHQVILSRVPAESDLMVALHAEAIHAGALETH
ncbi:MAG: DUF58 domain-containing protein [Verrucomicrobia bacterium]|jgi:uncharacterized protein (DUF58 family)|nr:MAG: DUF58 domain-containing protein [Verrucomicrobiota bacterium]